MMQTFDSSDHFPQINFSILGFCWSDLSKKCSLQQVSARASCTMGQSYAGEALLLETWSKHAPGGAAPLGLTGQWFPMGSLAFWGRDHRTADTSRQGHCTAQLQGRVRQDLCMHMGVCKCIWELFKHSKLQKIKMAQVPKNLLKVHRFCI